MSFLLDQTPPASSSSAGRCWTMGSDLFNAVMPHHQGIQALWETKWKFPCAAGMYPFHDGKFADFEPVFKALIRQGVTDGTSADYTHAFTATAEALAAAGDASARQGNATEASSFYLRSACVYRIARFPYITGFSQTDPNDDDSDEDNSAKWKAWQAQKDVYMRAGRTWSPPVVEVDIFHTYRQGMDRDKIPVYVRAPATASPEKPCPLVILMTGLDGYRPDNTQRCDELTRRGWATLVVEIPGTADCPADPADPSSPDRLWSSVLEWAQRDGRFDMDKVMVWGLSAGAYYAVRVAHTHADMLRGVVAQGAGCHYWFDPEWLEKSQGHEYPFDILHPLSIKYGYNSVQAFVDGSQAKFSLLTTGILDGPSTRLLLINGINDGLMPIEDSTLLFEHGSPKEARLFPGAVHMGYPDANKSVYPWLESLVSGESSTAAGKTWLNLL